MAGPQFLTPKKAVTSRVRRHFTLTEANRSLPLVSRIVADVVRSHQAATEIQSNIESVTVKAQQQRLSADLQANLDHLHEYMQELAGVGCEMKDPSIGLIDFIGRHEGRDVYLCWKLGEQTIGYWHELNAGIAGRRPVAQLNEEEDVK